MPYKKYLSLLLLIFCLSLQGQVDTRISTIENKLELLKIDYPEFEENVNVNISNTSLSNFLLAISKVHGININVSPELDSVNIINNFSNVSIADLLVFLAREYDLNIGFTGNIISVSPHREPEPEPVEKEISAIYNLQRDFIDLDLRKDPLEKVFRKITEVSGKNLVFAPGMEDILLSMYISNVPFESAMEKLALANNLKLTQSRDGFYIFNSLEYLENGTGVNTAIALPDNFYFRILDPANNTIEVDFNNVAVSDIIYTLGEDLNLNIFTATPLNDLGQITVTAENIQFDHLLDKIFESVNSTKSPGTSNDQINSMNNLGDNGNGDRSKTGAKNNFTYKKEGEIYFFGTEDQLALKQVEVVQMMHRSIEMLTDPTRSSQNKVGQGRNDFMTGTTSFYGNNNATGNMQGNNQNNSGTRNSSNSNSEANLTENIKKIIPDELLTGIDVKIDSELNSFVISGPAARIERFKNFIRYIDKPVPVILIEVMILEVNRNAIVQTGISFGLDEEPVETAGKAFPSTDMRLGAETINRVIGGFNGFGSFNMGKVLPNFYMDIKAMESNGNIKILSTPKLSTLNGHKAHLSSGQTTYYAVTNQSFFGSQIPQSSEITNYYPIDAELALDIMPFVSGDGEITLDINVVQSSFNGERIAENAPPGMNSREFSSIIRMRDQDVAILGGIEESSKDDSGSGVPVLSRIPVLKWFFSERRREDSKRKLNILIKPTVIY